MKKLMPVRTTTSAAIIAGLIALLQQNGVNIPPELQSAAIVIGSALIGKLIRRMFDPGDGA